MWCGWLLTLVFFVGIAPMVLIASAWVGAIATKVTAQALGVAGDALAATVFVASLAGWALGVLLTWLTWNRAVTWYRSRSATK